MLKFLNATSPGEKEKPDYLYEIGSGENWMGYHIAFFLALHEKFLTISQTPVFSFLIVDQPTQVYFPSVETVSTYDLQKSGTHNNSKITGETPSSENISESTEQDIESTIHENANDSAVRFDNDIKKARRIFEVLSQSVKQAKGLYQIIVTEHADKDVWGDIDMIHEVADWRGEGSDRYLVPPEWVGMQKTDGNVPSNHSTESSEQKASGIFDSSENKSAQQTQDSAQKDLFSAIEDVGNTETSHNDLSAGD